MKKYDVIVIGAGASGLFFAQKAGELGKSVLVLDHANKAGKKILMSGGGKCNFTNLEVGVEYYVGDNPQFCRSALSRFSNWDFISLVMEHGIEYEQREHGQLFCVHSADDILQMLLERCQRFGVHIQTKTTIDSIEHQDDFMLHTTTKDKHREYSECYQACHLVIATGGLSIPTMGATGFGYQVAKQFGHHIVPTTPSLVPFTFTDKVGDVLKSLAGISLEVRLFNDKASFVLPVLFTHRGLSGPASLQLSNYWQLGEPIFMDVVPSVEMGEFLIAQKNNHAKRLIRTVLDELPTPLPKNLVLALELLLWQEYKDTQLANIKDDTLRQIGERINAWRLLPSGVEGYRVAEVTRGGVDTQEISSKTMESKLVPNLYFIGEVLDVAGHLGGYNFQWAWASAYACATALVKTT